MTPLRYLLPLTLLLTPAQAAPPETPAPLYQATAIVTGTDTRQRPAGLADALHQVIRKLTATPNPDTAALDPASLIDHFTYVDPRAALLPHDDQGTSDRPHELTVWFRPEPTDAAIARLGLRLWPEPRPILLPVILVRTRDPEPFLLSPESTAPLAAPMRAALVRIAASYGVGVHIPTAAELAEWAVDTVGPPEPLRVPTEGRLLVAGTLSFDIRAHGWTAFWHTAGPGPDRRWTLKGVSFDDAFASMAAGTVEPAAAAR